MAARRAWWLGLAAALLGCLQVLGGWSARWHAHDGFERHVHWSPSWAAAWAPVEHRAAQPGLEGASAERATRRILVDEELSVRLPELLLVAAGSNLPEVPPAVLCSGLPESMGPIALAATVAPPRDGQRVGPRGSAPPDRPGTGVERLVERGSALRL